LYKGPREHGYPIYKAPKKEKKKTPKPKSDALEGAGDLKDKGKDESSNAGREEASRGLTRSPQITLQQIR